MILILSKEQDLHVQAVVEHLERLDKEYLVLDISQLGDDYFMELRPGGEYRLLDRSNALKLNLRSIKSVWYRRPQFRNAIQSSRLSEEALKLAEEEERTALDGLWLGLDVTWLNNPFANRIASNKVNQLRVASELGFSVPDTVITDSPSVALEFIQAHNEVVYKVMGKSWIDRQDQLPLVFLTNKVGSNQLQNIDEVAVTPCLFQEYTEKDFELRVVVVGERVFTAKINSQEFKETETDWRRDPTKLTYSKYELPKDVQQRCVGLLKAFDLTYGAIDLIYTKSGSFVFLEINPNGQWLWIEKFAGLPISLEIARVLVA